MVGTDVSHFPRNATKAPSADRSSKQHEPSTAERAEQNIKNGDSLLDLSDKQLKSLHAYRDKLEHDRSALPGTAEVIANEKRLIDKQIELAEKRHQMLSTMVKSMHDAHDKGNDKVALLFEDGLKTFLGTSTPKLASELILTTAALENQNLPLSKEQLQETLSKYRSGMIRLGVGVGVATALTIAFGEVAATMTGAGSVTAMSEVASQVWDIAAHERQTFDIKQIAEAGVIGALTAGVFKSIAGLREFFKNEPSMLKAIQGLEEATSRFARSFAEKANQIAQLLQDAPNLSEKALAALTRELTSFAEELATGMRALQRQFEPAFAGNGNSYSIRVGDRSYNPYSEDWRIPRVERPEMGGVGPRYKTPWERAQEAADQQRYPYTEPQVDPQLASGERFPTSDDLTKGSLRVIEQRVLEGAAQPANAAEREILSDYFAPEFKRVLRAYQEAGADFSDQSVRNQFFEGVANAVRERLESGASELLEAFGQLVRSRRWEANLDLSMGRSYGYF